MLQAHHDLPLGILEKIALRFKRNVFPSEATEMLQMMRGDGRGLRYLTRHSGENVCIASAPGRVARDFGDITPDEVLQTQLRLLYGSVDRMEFYVGLFAEPRSKDGPLPPLLQTMVAVDAFSQALTNPLLSEHVWGNADVRLTTFTRDGLDAIDATSSLRDILARNSQGLGDRFVGMTRQGWAPGAE